MKRSFLSRLLGKWFSSASGAGQQPIRRKTCRPTLEALETRELMSVKARLQTGILLVSGTAQPDDMVVRQVNDRITIAGVATTFPVSRVSRVDVHGRGGDDVIDVRGVTVPLSLDGGAGSDRFLVDPASRVRFPGFDTQDRVEFSDPTRIVKHLVSAAGDSFALHTDGTLRIGGGAPSWTNQRDFHFDGQNRLLLLDRNGALDRSRQPYGAGGWEEMGRGVLKYALDANGGVWALQADGAVRVNGAAPSWTNQADFAFDRQNRLLLLDRTGTLSLSLNAYGSGGWRVLGQHPVKYVQAANGSWWVLQENGELRVDGGAASWTNQADFSFDEQNRVILLDQYGTLARSQQPYGSGGWQELGRGVVKYQLTPSGNWFVLQSDGSVRVDGGPPSWTNQADFAFDGQNRVILLDRSGTLARSQQPYGTGGWQELGRDVVKYQQAADGAWWVLQRGGELRIEGGAPSWAAQADFLFDDQNRVLLLDRYGSLARSQQPYGSGGWLDLGQNVAKYLQAANGSWWVLQNDGQLRVDGAAPSWTNQADFSFDAQNRVILLDRSGALARSQQPYGSGGWQELGRDVLKYQQAANGSWWVLQRGGELRVDGGAPSWTNQADFAFDGQNRVILLDRSGALSRSQQPYGSGGWQELGRDVLKYQQAANGSWWVLQWGGEVRVEGAAPSWTNQADFFFDHRNHVLLRDRTATLSRSLQPFGQGGWQELGRNVIKHTQLADGSWWVLQANGDVRVNGGTPSWAGIRDIAFDAQNRVIMLDRNGTLDRSRQAYGNGGFDVLGRDVLHYQQAANGVWWVLTAGGNLYVDGSLGWGGTKDFVLGPDNVLYWLGMNGTFQRSRAPYGEGGWDTLGQNVVKYLIAEDGRTVFTLTGTGDVCVNGGAPSWTQMADFALDAKGRLYLLNRPTSAGWLQRSRDPYGSGGWDTLGRDVAKFVVADDGEKVYALTASGDVHVNGAAASWNRMVDLAVDRDGRLLLLNSNGHLLRSVRRHGDGGWETLQTSVGVFTLNPDGLTVTARPPAWVEDRLLYIVGSSVRDVMNLRMLSLNTLHVAVNDMAFSFDIAAFSNIVIQAGASDDQIRLNTSQIETGIFPILIGIPLPAYIDAGDGNDYVLGGWGNDYIVGGRGDDYLLGSKGHDILSAGFDGWDVLDEVYDLTEGDDTYFVEGSAWVQPIYEFRRVHRANGQVVRVREDNQGRDELYYNARHDAFGNPITDGASRDGMDDDGFWDGVGRVLEEVGKTALALTPFGLTLGDQWGKYLVNGLKIVGTAVVSFATGGLLSGLMGTKTLAGTIVASVGSNLAGQGLSLALGWQRQFSWAGLAGAGAGSFSRWLGAADPSRLTWYERGLRTAVGATVNAGMSALLNGGSVNWASLGGSFLGGFTNGATAGWFQQDFTILNSRLLGATAQSMLRSALANGTRAALTGRPFDWQAVVTSLVQVPADRLVETGLEFVQRLADTAGVLFGAGRRIGPSANGDTCALLGSIVPDAGTLCREVRTELGRAWETADRIYRQIQRQVTSLLNRSPAAAWAARWAVEGGISTLDTLRQQVSDPALRGILDRSIEDLRRLNGR